MYEDHGDKKSHPGESAANSIVTSQQDDHEELEGAAEDGRKSASNAAVEQNQMVTTEDFSIFTRNQKRAIIVVCSFASWFSPMSGSIYTPAIDTIGRELHVSNTQINLTVTTYLIFQGIAPMMIAGFSDTAGRRPAYAICFVIYIAANLALALQNNYVALLVLRMVQAAGSSGTVALANGVVGDLTVSSERGQYVAFASLGAVLGPTVSPIIGGLLSQFLGWHSIFWFLLILSVVFAIPMALFLPETCRKLVGNHSFPPPWTSANLYDRKRFANRAKQNIPIDQQRLEQLRANHKLTIPNPLSTLRILFDLESILILLPSGLAFALFYALQTALSAVFKRAYGFNEIQVALMFLPIGGGSLISAFTTGALMDWNYRRLARRLNFPLVKNRQTDLAEFPIEKARLQICMPLLFGGAASIIAYGWILDVQQTHHVSLAAPIIMLFIFGYTLIAGSQSMNVLMVDLWPEAPAAATAGSNVTRCLLGAAASAAIGPMSEKLGQGWSYTLLGALFVVASSGMLSTIWYGKKWRAQKKARVERKEQKRREQENRMVNA